MSELGYLDLVRDILDNGVIKDGRNGRTIEVFGRMLRFSLENNSLPLLTTKKMGFKTILKELLWFVKGQTNNAILNQQNVNIWNGNASKEFLELNGLDYPEGILGPIYGWQWRNFNGEYNPNVDIFSIEGRIDQLQEIIDQLKDPEKRNSRRLILSAWNPAQIKEMALPPCHMMCQFSVTNGKLSCLMTQRSADVGLGLPYNIASYSILTHLIAYHCGLQAKELIISLGSCHIYEEHIEALTEQIQREIYPFPQLIIKQSREKIEEYQCEDFEVSNYISHNPIKMKMIA